jgi:hypothetical protein
MPAEPSLKGAAIAQLVADVQACLSRSEADRMRLETKLSPDTVGLLEGKVEIGNWYPVHMYNELTDLIWQEEGGGRDNYLRQRGEKMMKRLMEAGLYQQLDFLNRIESGLQEKITLDDIQRTCRLIGSVSGSIRNFGKDTWVWDPDKPGCIIHHLRDALHFSEMLRLVSEGSENFVVQTICGEAPRVTSERVAPDYIVYRSDYRSIL